MTKQLNVRVSDLHYSMFETIQEDFEKRGLKMNKRELLEYMINETMIAETRKLIKERQEK